MFVLAGEPCLYRSPHCVGLTDRLSFREWTSQRFFRLFLLFLHQKEFVCISLLLDFATMRSNGSFPCSGRVGVLAKW